MKRGQKRTEQVETPRQAIERARDALMQMDTRSEGVQEIWAAVCGMAQQLEWLQESLVVSLEREMVVKSQALAIEEEMIGLRREALERGREYITRLMGKELDMDPAMVDLVLAWMEGRAPADVSPFFVNQLRESVRELRDVIAAERGIEGL